MSINSEKTVRKSDHHVVKLLPESLLWWIRNIMLRAVTEF